MRIRYLLCSLFLLICIFCSGCKSNNSIEKSYSYEIKTFRSDSKLSGTYRVYIKGDKWRQEEFENNNSKPHTIMVFDGRNVYIRSAYSGVQGYLFPEKMKDATKNFKNITIEEGRKLHMAYSLLNWKQNSEEIFRRSIKPIQSGKSKTKYGYSCSKYRYSFQSVSRDVCVNNELNMAVSIINKFPTFEDSFYLVKANNKNLDDNIFTYFSLLKKTTK